MPEEVSACYQAFQQLQVQRGETLAPLSQWSPQRLSFRLCPGSWCAIEVLDHIVRAETGTMADVQNGLKNPHLLGSEVRPGIAALQQALLSNGSFRVPPEANAIYPDPHATLPDVLARWDRSRRKLGQLVSEVGPAISGHGVFHHPFAGWMTFVEVLDHFAAHLHHHRFQLARLESASQELASQSTQ